MSIELDLDTRDIGQGIYNYVVGGLSSMLQQWAESAADMVLDNWRAAASGTMFPGMNRALNSDAYRLGLERGDVQFDGQTASVTVGAPEETALGTRPFNLHRMIEYGRPAYNIRDQWLAHGAPGARMSSKPLRDRTGRYAHRPRYIVIPFRHGSGESVHFGTNLDPTVRRLARTGAVNEGRYGRTRNPWESAVTQHTPMGRPNVSLGLGPRFQKPPETGAYTWKRAILAGVKRYGRGGHSQYMTFRTMSESSDPSAWVVPALSPNPVARAVRDASARTMRERIRADMEQMAQGGMRA